MTANDVSATQRRGARRARIAIATLALLFAGTLLWGVPHVQQNLAQRARTALEQADIGESDVSLSFSGRDATLVGSDPNLLARARSAVSGVSGVRRTETELHATPAVDSSIAADTAAQPVAARSRPAPQGETADSPAVGLAAGALLQRLNAVAAHTRFFTPGQASLASDVAPALNEIALLLKHNPGPVVQLNIYTPVGGNPIEAVFVTQTRARIFLNDLVRRGVPPFRVLPSAQVKLSPDDARPAPDGVAFGLLGENG